MKKFLWPTMHFGPVNLWTVVPASWFYLPVAEKQKHSWAKKDTEHTKYAEVRSLSQSSEEH